MSDDSFFREVNEEMRRAQAQALWDRYGPLAIVVAIVVVLLTGGFVAYEYWTTSRANSSGDAFSQALRLANDGKPDEAMTAFAAIEADGHGAYPVLARMRSATVLAEKGDFAAAVAAFDAVAADGSIPQALRDMALLRAGFVLVDNGSAQDVRSRLEPMTDDGNALRHSAREAIALASWKEGEASEALRLFELIVADQAAPRNVRDRASMMVELIRGSGTGS